VAAARKRPLPFQVTTLFIVKFWEANEYPQLAANEYFCLTVARQCGLDVPPFRLAEDGAALVIEPIRSAHGWRLIGVLRIAVSSTPAAPIRNIAALRDPGDEAIRSIRGLLPRR
jgi:hypothetical protein